MSEDWVLYAEPCPSCGATDFLEEASQVNIVEGDRNGEPIDIYNQGIETDKVWCNECDILLFDANE